MDQMKIAAGTRYEHAAATPDVPVSKDTQKSLAFHQKRVYNLLQSGKKYSVAKNMDKTLARIEEGINSIKKNTESL